MSEYNGILPVLKVADLDRALDFYCNVLEFSIRWREPNDGGGDNCMVEAGAARLMLSTGAHLGDKPHFTGTLYFDMKGVHALFERIRNSVEIVWPLEKMDYGQSEFGIRDRDGYLLAFAERDE